MTGGPRAAELVRLTRAVEAAGALAMRHFRNSPRQWEKRPGAVVSEADILVDRLLFEALAAGTDDAWLSEEAQDDPRRVSAGRVWIVDPIDGTRAFVEGIADFAISVALLEAGRMVLGVIHDPVRQETFTAQDGRPALLDGTPIRVGRRAGMAGARLFASRRELKRHGLTTALEGTETASGMSLARKLALVACGRADALVSFRRSHDWDVAAALLLIERAGGRLTDGAGRPLVLNRPDPRQDGLIAGPPALHALLLSRLRPCAAAPGPDGARA